MSNLSAFMAGNAIKDDVVKYVASKRFIDGEGKAIEWELNSVDSDVDEEIRKSCTRKVQVPGKKNTFIPETDYTKYVNLLAVKCITFPNLHDIELQNSYGVMGAENLLKKMLKPGEYQDLLNKIHEINGFNVSMNDLVEEAKN